ncbi:MAG: translocation/assembly module TamB domain-containing protein, partial [Pseudomonadales bacterium]|nr:translocation/assembly module TamB domain-containing protein [Pseudomonadales bacterium]
RAHVELRQSSPAVPASADVVIVGAQSPTPQPRWHLDSDLLIELGDRVEFKGHGFDGLVSGKLRLIDSGSAPPSGSGELRVDKGRFAIYGKQLNIERGRLLFAQSPLDDPAIDLLATRRHGELTVGVQGRGTAQTPRITLYASEPMAQSEILSWLVVGKPLSQVGQGDSDLLMGAASSAFLQGGELLSQWLGQRLGIGNVAIEQDDFSQQPWLTLGTQLSPRLHLGYYFGLMAGDNKVVLRYRLGRAWSLQGESGAASGADLLYSPR